MSEIDRVLNDLNTKLHHYHVEEPGLSFVQRKLKLNNEKDAKVVAEEIEKCTNLTVLNLDGNTVGVNAAKRIARSLITHGELKRAIWKNMFTGRTKEEIPDALRFLCCGIISAQAHLVELDLSDNAFGPICVNSLNILLTSPSCFTLEILRLNGNGLGITGGKLLSESLNICYEASGHKFALRVFQAGRNGLENPGAVALAQVLKKLGTLVEVSMPQNSIYHKGIETLSEAFKNNPHLKILNLNDNTVCAKSAAALASALPVLKNLETLNLGNCLLKTDGALLIAKALTSKNLSLKTLIVDHNEIDIEGGMQFVRAMQNKNSLSTLNLNGNNFGEEGISKITLALTKSGQSDALQSFSDDEGGEEKNDKQSAGAEVEVADSLTASGNASLPKMDHSLMNDFTIRLTRASPTLSTPRKRTKSNATEANVQDLAEANYDWEKMTEELKAKAAELNTICSNAEQLCEYVKSTIADLKSKADRISLIFQ